MSLYDDFDEDDTLEEDTYDNEDDAIEDEQDDEDDEDKIWMEMDIQVAEDRELVLSETMRVRAATLHYLTDALWDEDKETIEDFTASRLNDAMILWLAEHVLDWMKYTQKQAGISLLPPGDNISFLQDVISVAYMDVVSQYTHDDYVIRFICRGL